MSGRVTTRAEALRNRGRRLDAEARAAKRERLERERKALNARQKAVNARREEMREKGRILDQTELCYRQYEPQQIAKAEEMQALAGFRILMEDLQS